MNGKVLLGIIGLLNFLSASIVLFMLSVRLTGLSEFLYNLVLTASQIASVIFVIIGYVLLFDNLKQEENIKVKRSSRKTLSIK